MTGIRAGAAATSIALLAAGAAVTVSTGAAAGDTTPAPKSNAENCAAPVSARAGGRLCINIEASRKLMGENAVKRANAQGKLGAPAKAQALADGVCSVAGCWDAWATYAADFSGIGSHGYGQTPLGETHMNFTDRLSGYKTTSYPYTWSATGATSGVYQTLERLYMATVTSNGTWLDPRLLRVTPKSGLKAAGVSASMPSTSWYRDQRQGTMWRDVNWNVPGYPGRWYQMVKSVVFYRAGDGTGLKFYTSDALPSNPANAGWNP